MADRKETTVSISGDESIRGGHYTNFQRIASSPSETVIDFLFVDDFDSDGDPQSGVVQTRVVMTNEKLSRFADLIKSHLEKSLTEIEDGD